MKANFIIAGLLTGLPCLTTTAESIDDSIFVSAEALQPKKVAKSDVGAYENDSDDEEVYTEATEVVTVENTYDKFYDKVKHSIVKVSNGTSTFYGAVVKDNKGIYVVTDKSSVKEGTITIKPLEGKANLKIDSAKATDSLMCFKIKAPFPKQLNPVALSNTFKVHKTVSLAAVSFDYGDDPEMTTGKGRGKGGVCEITSQLRRCRPGSPLFSPKGQLFGIIGWKATGNVGLTVNTQKKWIPVKYPFEVPKPSRKKKARKGSRYDS